MSQQNNNMEEDAMLKQQHTPGLQSASKPIIDVLIVTAPEIKAERDKLKETNAELLEAGQRVIAWIDAGCDPSDKSIRALRTAITKATAGEV